MRSPVRHLLSGAAFVALFVALTLPNRLDGITWSAFLVYPLEFVAICLLLLAGGRSGTLLRLMLAILLGLAILLRSGDLATHQIFARQFNLVFDSHLLADGSRLLTGVLGDYAVVGAALLLVLAGTLMFWLAFAVLGRIQQVLHLERRFAAVAVLVLLLAWGVSRESGSPRAGNFAWDQLAYHARETFESVRDMRNFAASVNDDYLAARPAEALFDRLGDKDVFVIFAESYGRVALELEPFAGPLTATLRQAQEQLAADGVSVRSAFLASPTIGGMSWLAHASVVSGAWIDSETRYESLIVSDRITLNRLFQQAGWRTVAAMPAISMAWPEGQYFGYDHIYDAHNFGYQGLPYNWVTMPDQYVLSALQARERSALNRAPVMAEIALISSHAPWTPVAQLVPWGQVGNGSIFSAQAQSGPSPEEVWREVDSIRSHYRQTLQYTIRNLVSYVLEYGDENLVILVMGDHAPMPMVSGDWTNSHVPVHLIARDPKVMDAIADWQWGTGMLPGPDAPVWPMDQLRNRFVEAFSASLGAAE